MEALYNGSCIAVNNLRCLFTYKKGYNLFPMNLAKRLKKAREDAKLTQAQLAKRSGVKQQMISKLERGTAKSTSDIVTIASAVGVSAQWLATGEGTTGVPHPEQRLSDEARELAQRIDGLPKKLKQQVVAMIQTIYTLNNLGFKIDLSSGEGQENFLRHLEKTHKALKHGHH